MTTGEKVIVLGAIGAGLVVVGYLYYKKNMVPAATAGAAIPAGTAGQVAGQSTPAPATGASALRQMAAADTNLKAYDNSPLATAAQTGIIKRLSSAVATPEQPPAA